MIIGIASILLNKNPASGNSGPAPAADSTTLGRKKVPLSASPFGRSAQGRPLKAYRVKFAPSTYRGKLELQAPPNILFRVYRTVQGPPSWNGE
jgi:hypothetical protein